VHGAGMELISKTMSMAIRHRLNIFHIVPKWRSGPRP